MTAHRYWRLYAVTTSSYNYPAAIGEIELRSVPGGASISIPGNGVVSASSYQIAAPDAAFDASTATAWFSAVSVSAGNPQWVGWDFGPGNEQSIIEIALANGGSSNTMYAVTSGYLAYSDDNTTWTTFISFSGRSNAASASNTYAYTPPASLTGALVAPSAIALGYSGARGCVVLPAALVSAFGAGAGSALLPAATVAAYSGGVSGPVSPAATLVSQGHNSAGERSAELTCPRPTLSAYSGANATLSSSVPTLHITATVTNFGVAALRAPTGSVFSSGTVSGMAAADLNAPMATLAGYSGAVCSLTLTGRPAVLASGTTGGVGGADIRSPSPRLVSSGMAQGYGSANLLAPAGHLGATARAWLTAPSPMLTATGHAVVAATYEAYAINLNHAPGNQEPVDEVTHYTNFQFNGIMRYQSSYYGWGADGLYLLEGTTDNAAPIQYAVKTGLDDLGTANLKNVASAYFAGRIGPDMTVTLYAGEDGQASYDYHTANGPQARTHREKFARGVTDRYFAIGVSGKGALELADIELEINKLKRKT